MTIDTLKDLYMAELEEAYSFAAQFAETLPKLRDAAGDEDLSGLLAELQVEVDRHVSRLSDLLETNKSEDSHTDAAMKAILQESRDWITSLENPAVRDAALVASLQRVMHYAIAVHGSLGAWAGTLDLPDVEIISQLLEDSREADSRLSEIGAAVNRAA